MLTANETELFGEVKSFLTTHLAGQHYMTQDELANSTKTITDLIAKFEGKQTTLETEFAEYKTKAEADARAAAQRGARGPAGGIISAGAADVRSLGERVTETAEFKAAAAHGFTRRERVSVTLNARTRPAIDQRAVTIGESGFPMLPTRVGIFAPPFLPLVMRDLLTVVPLTIGNSIEYVLETWNYAADYQLLEGDRKAQGDATYTEKTANVRTIAWFIKASRQMMADVPYFASTVDSQLLYGLALKEDQELLNGTGAAGHLLGILPQATLLPAGVLTGTLTTPIDTAAAMVAYLGSIGYKATGIVMNPLDWASIQILKNTYGAYLLGGPPVANAVPTLWGIPVVSTLSMAKGTILVGAFPPNAALFDREAATVEISYENEDDFVTNLCTIRCEERIALAVYRPAAFVTSGPLVWPAAVPLAAEHAPNGGKGTK